MNMKKQQDKKIKYPTDFLLWKKKKRQISMLTAYDATMAYLLSRSNVDAFLVGDSLGMVMQGNQSTVPVTLENMIYHGQLVRRGAPQSFIVLDMPFASYHFGLDKSLENALNLFQSTHASALKLEGAEPHLLQLIERLSCSGVPIMGHLGLMPQRFLNMGGFRLTSTDKKTVEKLEHDCLALQKSGCFAVVLELVNEEITKKISQKLRIPVIGIGAGKYADGQIRVVNDLFGMDPRFSPSHCYVYETIGEKIMQFANEFHDDTIHFRYKSKL